MQVAFSVYCSCVYVSTVCIVSKLGTGVVLFAHIKSLVFLAIGLIVEKLVVVSKRFYSLH